jgi:DeoR/GlpR family transcriptional regulator of sugar metabolism
VVSTAERRDLLLTRLARDGKLIAKDLAADFGLSDDSVRRDLRELAAAGLCQRVYGGALPVSPALGVTHARRWRIAPDSKRRVGARAAALSTPGSTVILGVQGVHPHEGFTTEEPEEAALIRILLSRAASSYIMASTEKLGTVSRCKLTDLADVTGIITDALATQPVVHELRDHGATIIQA